MFTKLKLSNKRMKNAIEKFFSVNYTEFIQKNVTLDKYGSISVEYTTIDEASSNLGG